MDELEDLLELATRLEASEAAAADCPNTAAVCADVRAELLGKDPRRPVAII